MSKHRQIFICRSCGHETPMPRPMPWLWAFTCRCGTRYEVPR